MPTGEKVFSISNTHYKTMVNKNWKVFFECLSQFRGPWIQQLRNANYRALEKLIKDHLAKIDALSNIQPGGIQPLPAKAAQPQRLELQGTYSAHITSMQDSSEEVLDLLEDLEELAADQGEGEDGEWWKEDEDGYGEGEDESANFS